MLFWSSTGSWCYGFKANIKEKLSPANKRTGSWYRELFQKTLAKCTFADLLCVISYIPYMFIGLILKYYPNNTLLYVVFYFAQENDKNRLFAIPSLSCVHRGLSFSWDTNSKVWCCCLALKLYHWIFSNYSSKLTCYTDYPIYFEVALQLGPLWS